MSSGCTPVATRSRGASSRPSRSWRSSTRSSSRLDGTNAEEGGRLLWRRRLPNLYVEPTMLDAAREPWSSWRDGRLERASRRRTASDGACRRVRISTSPSLVGVRAGPGGSSVIDVAAGAGIPPGAFVRPAAPSSPPTPPQACARRECRARTSVRRRQLRRRGFPYRAAPLRRHPSSCHHELAQRRPPRRGVERTRSTSARRSRRRNGCAIQPTFARTPRPNGATSLRAPAWRSRRSPSSRSGGPWTIGSPVPAAWGRGRSVCALLGGQIQRVTTWTRRSSFRGART